MWPSDPQYLELSKSCLGPAGLATLPLERSGARPLLACSPHNFRVPHTSQIFTNLSPSYPAAQVPLLSPGAALPSPRPLFPGQAPDPVSRPPSQQYLRLYDSVLRTHTPLPSSLVPPSSLQFIHDNIPSSLGSTSLQPLDNSCPQKALLSPPSGSPGHPG